VFRPVSRRLVDGPYVLYVGSEHPRKNLAVLLEAFAEVKRETGWGDLRLVKVGPAGGGDGGYRELTMATVDRLGLTLGVDVLIVEGRVPVEDLAAYYSGALCLVQPSRYEGFGMTALEAMACGCPTIVSRATSLPEVVGDAALAVPPDDVAGFASAIRSVVSDRTLAKDLAACAVERAARFSWERCAKETRAVYEKVLAQL
jgi:glycosyltransferase involved in cell wall biosynthesis